MFGANKNSQGTDVENRLLTLIYQLSKGDTEKILNRKNISAAAGLRPSEGEHVLKALTSRRMIAYRLFGSLCITEAGIVVAQSLQVPVSSKLFLSYRRADSRDISERIYDKLVGSFSDELVFKDLNNKIPPGSNFKDHLKAVIADCTTMLVVIGLDWLSLSGSSGSSRLFEAEDYVRIELEYAIEQNLLVIPVLVAGASMPPMSHLPTSIQKLSSFQALEVRRDPDFHSDMSYLISKIRR